MISLHGGPKDHGFGLPPLARPGATFVIGFKALLDLGYCVTKGHRAIRLLAPLPIKEHDLPSGEPDGLRRLVRGLSRRLTPFGPVTLMELEVRAV